MDTKLMRALKEAESNIYSGVRSLNGAIVFVWTLLCLFLINNSKSFVAAAASGVVYYLLSVALYLCMFKGISRYLCFPADNKKMPVFIGHKLDTVFTYPIILMALIGIISSLLTTAALFPASAEQINAAAGTTAEIIVRALLLPLIAFAEEFMNLLVVSFVYTYIIHDGKHRLIKSVILAALIFGILHTFGQGVNAAIPIGISYIPVFFATLYTGNIWISFLAHLYNDLISLAKYYNSSLHIVIIAAVSLIPAVWAIKTMLRKTH